MCIGMHNAYSIAVKASVTDTVTHKSCNGPITIAIRARFEYDSTTIRLRFGYNTLRDAYDSSKIQHPTRSYVLSSNNEHVNSFAML